jgi:hypothetical protein
MKMPTNHPALPKIDVPAEMTERIRALELLVARLLLENERLRQLMLPAASEAN